MFYVPHFYKVLGRYRTNFETAPRERDTKKWVPLFRINHAPEHFPLQIELGKCSRVFNLSHFLDANRCPLRWKML